ncbi:MarR family winged helix-turn-helix transcriptional regulator [Maridesulfovibrio ferrireducens]|uniref:MarR family winged helix-turn-helix transcriptional regulator n=1 Tax=Maridesulfovibrio ferrireducens TaxID=246191 RepID=UPI001A229E50|nr:MarR family winged helix-turn-helix transcriptional regulator [Maridesulfovibrio ferrireducens]MBI9112760.1 winged helix-turn-helix transcriptional regulator [Maridesulfovibrio ferrireducens]
MALEQIQKFDQNSPGRRLSIIHRLSMTYLSGPLSQIDIGRGKIPFLMKILCNEGIVQEDLTNYLQIDRAATARALQDLEKKGLVYRKEDREDRRRKLVYPTDKAKSLQTNIIGILKNHNEVLFKDFDEKERLLFMGMLNKMVDNLYSHISANEHKDT